MTKRLAFGLGLAGAVGVGLGAAVSRYRHRRTLSSDQVPASGRESESGSATLPRSATAMAPGIPVGSGTGIDRALDQPDTDLGGGVAGDTTPGSGRGANRDQRAVRDDDRQRNTL